MKNTNFTISSALNQPYKEDWVKYDETLKGYPKRSLHLPRLTQVCLCENTRTERAKGNFHFSAMSPALPKLLFIYP